MRDRAHIRKRVGGLAAGFLLFCPATVQAAVDYAPLNVPEAFQEKLIDRSIIDAYQKGYEPEVELLAPGVAPTFTRAEERSGAIRFIVNQTTPATVDRVNSLASLAPPVRALHVPVEGFTGSRETNRSTNFASKAKAARQLVFERLAHDGLLPTLVKVVAPLAGEAEFEKAEARDAFLIWAGFPSQLLRYFIFPPTQTNGVGVAEWTTYIVNEISKGKTSDEVAKALRAVEFKFAQTVPGFEVVMEAGEWPVRALRVQLGGGFAEGILPGGHIDVAAQLIKALPNADVTLSVPSDRADDIRRLAGRSWALRRANHLTLIADVVPITGWAQDNAKHGFVAGNASNIVVLSPSVASQDEGFSTPFPGDTLLLNGVKLAGATVAQSPLHFQGGNLMALPRPRTKGTTLLITEGTLYVNQAMGLSREEVLGAFKTEFGVSQCLVFPNASFHLDYDVTFRRAGEKLLALVNDPEAAAKIIVSAGLATLKGGKEAAPEVVNSAQEGFSQGKYAALEGLVREFRERVKQPQFVARFKRSAADYAGYNMALFAVAADVLLSVEEPRKETDADRAEYLRAVKRTLQRTHQQQAFLKELGCEVVPVPSLPDLRVAVNYLNGLHDADQFLLPVMGGMYAALDEAARGAFIKALGPGVRVTPILSTDLQRLHGALHCVAAAAPGKF